MKIFLVKKYSLKDNLLFKAKIIRIYCGVYSIEIKCMTIAQKMGGEMEVYL